jgi:hypothetical protein
MEMGPTAKTLLTDSAVICLDDLPRWTEE